MNLFTHSHLNLLIFWCLAGRIWTPPFLVSTQSRITLETPTRTEIRGSLGDYGTIKGLRLRLEPSCRLLQQELFKWNPFWRLCTAAFPPFHCESLCPQVIHGPASLLNACLNVVRVCFSPVPILTGKEINLGCQIFLKSSAQKKLLLFIWFQSNSASRCVRKRTTRFPSQTADLKPNTDLH